ncbi:MAG: endonuclease/exonuclease/phosphatase family protein [Labilithrix sp.]|nr:endonuclease/exonuclease/phosphatase family protein [Labilithrix sp.]
MNAIDVVSWNVLADSYVKPEYWPNTPPELLEPQRRRAALLDRLGTYVGDVDVVCLQEIEPAMFAAAEARLGAPFEGGFVKKQGKPDGCAIFVRRSLGAVDFAEHAYGDGTGHVALAARFGGIGIATTHLKWEKPEVPPEERLGRGELLELVSAWLRPGEPWIVCGDLNADASSPVLRVAFDRGLRDAYATLPDACTANSNAKRKRIDFILHTDHFEATPAPLPAIDDMTPLPSPTEPSDHLAIRARLLASRGGGVKKRAS